MKVGISFSDLSHGGCKSGNLTSHFDEFLPAKFIQRKTMHHQAFVQGKDFSKILHTKLGLSRSTAKTESTARDGGEMEDEKQ